LRSLEKEASIMNLILKLIFILLVSLWTNNMSAQLSTVNASSACNCDGTMTYNLQPSAAASFQLLLPNGSLQGSSIENDGNVTFSNLCPGVYQLIATYTGGPTTILVQINANGAPVGGANSFTICSTSAPSNLSNQITGFIAGGIWHRPNGATFSGNYNPLIETGGLYYYELNIGGCDITTGVFVSEIQNANPGNSTTYLICENYNEFFLTDFLAGTPDYGGQWFDSNAQPMDGFFDPATMDTETFTYMLNTVPGCPAVFSTLTVDENLIPNAGVTSSILVCPNAQPFSMTEQLLGTPDQNGFWFNNINQPANNIFDPAVDLPGTYRYFVGAFIPCPNQEAFLTIEFTNTNPSGSSGSLNICANGASVNMIDYLGGTPAPGGFWTNPQGQITDNLFNPLSENPGTYSYYYPNVGCSSQSTPLTITETSPPNAGVDATINLCQNANPIDLDNYLSGAQTTGYYTNSAGTTIPDQYSIAQAGTTVLTYTVASTVCPNDQSVLTINIGSPPPAPTPITLNFCSTDSDENLDLYYPTIPNQLWTNSAGVPVTTVFDPTIGSQNYTITSLSSNTCPSPTAVVSMIVDQPTFSNTIVDYSVCESLNQIDLETILPQLNYAGGTWLNDEQSIITSIISNLTPSFEAYTFISPEVGECASSELTIQLQIDESVYAGNDNSASLCISDNGVDLNSLLSISSNPLGEWMYNNNFQVSSNFDPSSSSAGLYYYQLPANGACPGDEAIISMFVDPGFPVEAGTAVAACAGSAPVQIGDNPNPNRTYLWTPAYNLSENTVANPIVSFTNSTPNPIDIEYLVQVSNGVCTGIDSVTVTINPIPLVSAADEIGVCSGESVFLSANGGTTYQWSPAALFVDPTSPTQEFTPLNSEQIYFDAQNIYGCTNTDSVNIIVHPLPFIDFEIESIESCSPYQLTLEIGALSENISDYNWYLGNQQISNNAFVNHIISTPGVYDLSFTGISEFGCISEWEEEDIITIYPPPFANFTYNPVYVSTIDNEVIFENLSIEGSEYSWDFGTGDNSNEFSPVYSFPNENAGIYMTCLEVLSEFGCRDTTCRQIVLENEYVFFAPTAFTPNSDGLNDVFKPIFQGFEDSTYELQIFDRWGTKIFETNDVNEVWVGDVRNGSTYAENGSYSWKVKIKVELIADYQEYSGHVMLVR
jgi:gliding motility-associated-like protein